MSDTKRLDLNVIDRLLAKLSEDNFKLPPPGYDAGLANSLSEALGCDRDLAISAASPDDPGSDMLLVLMYQNLLLAKRVSELEQRYDG